METVPVPNGPLTGNVLFYSRPEPLSIELHGKLGVNRSDTPFRFAEKAQAVPLQVTEFGFAAKSYPVIFAGDDRAPMAVMSIRANENLFIKDGASEPDIYIPAFIRRYPFALANNPAPAGAQNGAQAAGAPQMIVCIDRGADAIAENADVPLFVNGEPSDFAKQMIEFCSNFETERLRTESFVARMKALDLFETKQATFTPRDANNNPGQPIMLADYFAVSEEKLAALPAEVVMELHTSGALRQIYAHLDSMQNWERLVARSLAAAPVAANA
ncbi:MAG: SapC family protein [Caulobacteraceae bacterium]